MISRKRFVLFILSSLVVGVHAAQTAPALTSRSQQRTTPLHHIKTIYIEPILNIAEQKSVVPFLKKELTNFGFAIVDQKSEADAILIVVVQDEVVLDGDGSIPDKSIYRVELALPTKGKVWDAKVKFTRQPIIVEENQHAARKIAEKLANDWKKSAKRAGIK